MCSRSGLGDSDLVAREVIYMANHTLQHGMSSRRTSQCVAQAVDVPYATKLRQLTNG